MRIKGYTLLEMMLVLAAVAVFALLTVPVSYRIARINSVEREMDNIVFEQISAISQCDYHYYDNPQEEVSILFNRIGSVMHAETIHIVNRDVIIALGTGRVYVKKP